MPTRTWPRRCGERVHVLRPCRRRWRSRRNCSTTTDTLEAPWTRRAHGHEVAALADLFPPAALGGADADSHVYQTVGHECVGLHARCMNLPLFRKEIRGGSKKLDLVYASVYRGGELHTSADHLYTTTQGELRIRVHTLSRSRRRRP